MGVWIETWLSSEALAEDGVTPCVGVWIETASYKTFTSLRQGHTLRGCVDWNQLNPDKFPKVKFVTPCVGVWIETKRSVGEQLVIPVTPCVGVWIEMLNSIDVRSSTLVTPCVGVWIETSILLMFVILLSHTLRGCVDWNSE